jgi:hypothetical protein
MIGLDRHLVRCPCPDWLKSTYNGVRIAGLDLARSLVRPMLRSECNVTAPPHPSVEIDLWWNQKGCTNFFFQDLRRSSVRPMIGSEYSIQGSYEGYLNRLVRPMMESEDQRDDDEEGEWNCLFRPMMGSEA